jgi:hypothetical protein
VGEYIERQLGSYEYAEEMCRRFVVDRKIQGTRPQISACYYDPAMDAHTGTGRSNAEIMNDVFEKYDVPMIKAAKDRIGNAQMAYKMLKSGEFGICADVCPKTWSSFRTRMHDPKLSGGVLKVKSDDLDDVYDETVYGLNTYVDETIKPREAKAAETLQEYREAGLDEHSLHIYAAQLSRDLQTPEPEARMARGRAGRRM